MLREAGKSVKGVWLHRIHAREADPSFIVFLALWPTLSCECESLTKVKVDGIMSWAEVCCSLRRFWIRYFSDALASSSSEL